MGVATWSSQKGEQYQEEEEDEAEEEVSPSQQQAQKKSVLCVNFSRCFPPGEEEEEEEEARGGGGGTRDHFSGITQLFHEKEKELYSLFLKDNCFSSCLAPQCQFNYWHYFFWWGGTDAFV